MFPHYNGENTRVIVIFQHINTFTEQIFIKGLLSAKMLFLHVSNTKRSLTSQGKYK